jgi:hypothetical protein
MFTSKGINSWATGHHQQHTVKNFHMGGPIIRTTYNKLINRLSNAPQSYIANNREPGIHNKIPSITRMQSNNKIEGIRIR